MHIGFPQPFQVFILFNGIGKKRAFAFYHLYFKSHRLRHNQYIRKYYCGVNTDLLSSETVTAMRERRPDLHVMEVPGQGHAPLLMEDDIIARVGQFAALCDRLRAANPPEPGRRPPQTT